MSTIAEAPKGGAFSASGSQRAFASQLKRVYTWYTGGFVLFIVLLAIGEQMGLTRQWIGYLFLFATVGLYAVMAYSVSKRTREIGIRMALGAQRGDVLKLILKQGMLLTVIGLVVGLGASIALTRFFGGLLYGISPTDFATFATITILQVVVALVASYIPARRATKVNPLSALKYE